jgi:hypothetical protein
MRGEPQPVPLLKLRTPVVTVVALLLSVVAVPAEAPGPETLKAWDQYYAWANRRVEKEMSDPRRFLIEDFLPAAEQASIRKELNSGAIVVRRMTGVIPPGARFQVPHGEIHHWWGAVLVPNVKLAKVIAFAQDYAHQAGRFADIEKSQLLKREDDQFEFFFRLRRTKAFVTVYYNTWQECTYYPKGNGRVWSRSQATKIAELEEPGTPNEREKSPAEDRGYLSRLVSWWRFEQTDRGVIVECESASLSRDIPMIVSLIPGVASYIRSTPRESLESVLSTIRQYVKPAAGKAPPAKPASP